jgi:hypothetical protein
VGEDHAYFCTARFSPDGPEVGLHIDDPDQRFWRGDFVGDQPTAWCYPDRFSGFDQVLGEVLVVILTGARHDQCAHAMIDGLAGGAAWLRGVEEFSDRRDR